MINPLIAIPSPRDIPEVKEFFNTIEAVDKFWAKYYGEVEAYRQIRTFFLYEKQYDYLAIAPDDCLIHVSHVAKLCSDIIKLNNPPIICGIANVDNMQNRHLACVSEYPVRAFPRDRKYTWMGFDDPRIQKGEIIKVCFAGFPLMFIRRDVVRAIEFKNDGSCCVDTMFCWECYERDIPILADTSVRFRHLKIRDGTYQEFYAGSKSPYTYLEKRKV